MECVGNRHDNKYCSSSRSITTSTSTTSYSGPVLYSSTTAVRAGTLVCAYHSQVQEVVAPSTSRLLRSIITTSE